MEIKHFSQMTADELQEYRESGKPLWWRPSMARSVHTGTLERFEFNAPTKEISNELLTDFLKDPNWRMVTLGKLIQVR